MTITTGAPAPTLDEATKLLEEGAVVMTDFVRQYQALEAQVATLTEALRRFGAACEPWTEDWVDETPLRIGLPGYQKAPQFTLGDLRRARDIVKETGHD